MKSLLLFAVLVSLPLLLGGCKKKIIFDNVTLEIRDSIYVDPETGTPYSGKVVSSRPDEEGRSKGMEGFLKNGKWHGKTITYYNDGVWLNGVTKIETVDNNGIRIEETSWYQNGGKARETKYENGIPKLFTEFNDDGVKTLERRYKDGVVFKETLFHLNGKMKHMAIPEPDGTTYKGSKQKYWNSKGEPVDSWKKAEAE